MKALAPLREEQRPDLLPETPPHREVDPNMETFGHSGARGSQAFCDPVVGAGFCRCTNLMQNGTDTGIRASSLISAASAR